MRMLIIIFMLLFAFSVKGQPDFLTKKGNGYFYKNNKYNWKELGAVYKESEAASDLYKSGRTYKIMGQTTAYIGAGVIMAGISVAPGVSLQNKSTGFIIVGAGLFLELVAITPLIIGKQKLRQAMETFNFDMIKRHGYETEKSLSLSGTNNGFGLELQF